MLLQEFNCEIKGRRGSKNPVADHLSRIVTSNTSESPVCDHFPNKQLLRAYVESLLADIVNYLVTREMSKGWNKDDRARFLLMVWFFIQDDPFLFKYCLNQIIRRCVLEDQIHSVLSFCHDQCCGWHLMGERLWKKLFKANSVAYPI